MPTETFFRLPQEKRDKLILAIKRELARVPFADMSINRIVREAGIPRGSYYQYFRNKDDLFAFLLAEYRRLMRDCTEQALRENHGDLFAAVLAGFDVSAAFAREETNVMELYHLVCDRNPSDLFGFKAENLASKGSLWAECRPLVDTPRLNMINEEDYFDMMDLLFSVLAFTLAELFAKPAAAAPIRARLVRKLELMKSGLLRNDQNSGVTAVC